MRDIGIVVLVSLGLLACSGQDTAQASHQAGLEARMDAFVTADETLPGAAIWIISGDEARAFGAAAGVANPSGDAFSTDTPVRIASNTKTYVAATYLRLVEQGRADLDTPISELADPAFIAQLDADGYATDVITPRHLLMHTSGMAEHVSNAYLEAIFSDPGRSWTRSEQVALLVRDSDPLAEPGLSFAYSDTGYILIGDIIERLTDQPLSQTVREQMGLDAQALDATWWEIAEPDREPRAHQYLEGTDTHAWSASLDLYGGGGLVASTRDLAGFFARLMRGEIYDDPATLELMMTAPGHPEPESYRIGLQATQIAGRDAYAHSGFWGTYMVYQPELDIVVAATVLDTRAYRSMVELVDDVVTDWAAAEHDG